MPPFVILEDGCGASHYSCRGCRLKYTPTWRLGLEETRVSEDHRVSELVAVCVLRVKLCASLSRWPSVGNSVLVGEGTGGEMGKRGGFGRLCESLVLLKTKM